MKVSVIYCTARHGGLDILERSMAHQFHTDLEVIILDELHRGFVRDWPANFRFIDPPKKKPNMFWNLSASLNAGCRAATGSIIVLLQDYIWVPPSGITRFLDRFKEEATDCIISGVGHQYSEPSCLDDAKGLYSVWTDFPGPPSGNQTFMDPRMKKNGFYVTIPVEWEANWSAFPRDAWQRVGGFDEDFDLGWGYDNVNFAERCQLAGYNVMIDTKNEVLCYDHILIFAEKEKRDASPNNQALWHRKYRDLHKHRQPWRLHYAD